jgi:hypothetical protein
METRQELIELAKMYLNDIESEIDCRDDQLFDGELDDAIRYLDNLALVLDQLNNDDYNIEEFEESLE